jgi:hypothetical protein
MKYQEHRAERLSEQLSNVDTDLLAQAYEIDSAAKMKELCRQEKKATRVRAWRRIGVACACLLLVMGMVLTLPLWQRLGPAGSLNGGTTDDDQESYPPQDEMMGMPDTPGMPDIYQMGFIDSFDKLNYYAAIRLIEQEKNSLAAATLPYTVDFLTVITQEGNHGSGDDAVESPGYEGDESSGATAETPPTSVEPSEPGVSPDSMQDIWHYALQPDTAFTITQTMYCQIELTNETGFLASRIGTGTVDVVITMNDLDHMITFKNGDRFYTCLHNGGGSREMDFTTHKYIDGFYIVKNLAQDNFRFDLTLDAQGLITGMTCSYFKTDAAQACFTPDDITFVEGSSYTSYQKASFTINELNQYYSVDNEMSVYSEMIYSNEEYTFWLNSNGRFILYRTGHFDDEESHRRGSYQLTGNGIILELVDEEVAQRVLLSWTQDGGFVFEGLTYYPDLID